MLRFSGLIVDMLVGTKLQKDTWTQRGQSVDEGGEDGDAGHVFLAKKLAGETCAGCLATECCGQDIWQSLTLWECDSGAFIFGPGP